jgi:hypothetical protein
MMPPPVPGLPRRRPRSLQFAVFVAAVGWYFYARQVAESAANGLALRFDLGDLQGAMAAAFELFLVVLGIALLRAVERRKAPLRMTLGLPRRSTSCEEWATGAAIGWGLAVAAVLPMAIARTLNVRVWATPRGFELFGISLLTLAIATLAKDVGVHGYAFQRLVDATGPVRATIAMAVLSAIYAGLTPGSTGTAVVVSVAMSVLVSLCWLRTHAVWLMWGLHFAWAAATAAVFGLPLGGSGDYSSVIETRAIGPEWLTGGGYGPAGAMLSIFVVLAGIAVLVRATDDYAWDYTRPPIIPAGYDVTILPPAAHVAMEEAAKVGPVNPASLVQILPMTPGSAVARTPAE